MSWPEGKPTGLEGIVPDNWLQRGRWLRETDLVMVILHPEPAALGHCIVYPKKHSPRLEDCDPDVLSGMGMIVPEVKRAIRLVTGYRDFGLVLRSGRIAGQKIDQIYLELMPTIRTKPTFSVNFDPNNKRGKGQDNPITKKATHSLVSILRREMGMHHFNGFGCALLESDRMTVEFVDRPGSTGHMVISPKQVSPDLEDCDPIDFAACLWQLPKLARALKNTIRLEHFFVVILNGPDAGQETAHLSVHLVPCSGRGPSVDFSQLFTLKPTAVTERNINNAIRQILGQEIITLALQNTTAPRESAWPRPLSRQGINPVGTASPDLIRARSPHPAIDPWAMRVKSQAGAARPGSQDSMRPGSQGSILSSALSSRPPSRLATPVSIPPNRTGTGPHPMPGDHRGPWGGVFQRSANSTMNGGMTGMTIQHRPPSRLSVLSGSSSRDSGESRQIRRQENIMRDLDTLLRT